MILDNTGWVQRQDQLSWHTHIASTCARAKKLLGFLHRTFRLAGTPCFNHLFNVLVLPVLDYSSSIWDPPQKCYVTALERTLNFAARVVSGDWLISPTVLKERLGWPPLARRRLLQTLCLCRRILSDSSPIPSTIFHPHPKPGMQHHNQQPLFRPYVRTLHYRHFFTISVQLASPVNFDKVIFFKHTKKHTKNMNTNISFVTNVCFVCESRNLAKRHIPHAHALCVSYNWKKKGTSVPEVYCS